LPTQSHDVETAPVNYTIPFYVWGAGVDGGDATLEDRDLYALNAGYRTNPVSPNAVRPQYALLNQPVRNGDVANRVTDLLRLPPVGGANINWRQDLTLGSTQTVTGTPGVDDIQLAMSRSNLSIVVNNGTPTIVSAAGITRIVVNAGDGDDMVNVDPSVTIEAVLNGNAGNDNLTGGSGDDSLVGGAGNDVLNGGAGWDTVDYTTSTAGITVSISGVAFGSDGLAGQDTIQTTVESVIGGPSGDSVTGSSVANYLRGNGGDDTLVGLGGNDTLQGGVGNDTADYALSPAGVTISLDNIGTDLDGYGGNDNVLTDVERVMGSNSADNLRGSMLANTLTGGGGNDTLVGEQGTDSLAGGTGDDTYPFRPDGTLNLGTDTISEPDNAESDTIDFQNMTTAVTFNLTSASQTVGGFVTIVLSPTTGIENVIGTSAGDTITGNARPNRLTGSGGNDNLSGGDNNDTLEGGAGTDGLTGGLGSDTYVFSGSASLGTDTVNESTPGDTDVLDFSAFGVGANVKIGVTGNQPVAGILTLNLTSDTGIENVAGSNFNDTIEGNEGNNSLSGNGADDTLIGLGGADALAGGAGTDTADYSANGSSQGISITLDGVANDNDGRGATAENVNSDIEKVIGGAGDDHVHVFAQNSFVSYDGGGHVSGDGFEITGTSDHEGIYIRPTEIEVWPKILSYAGTETIRVNGGDGHDTIEATADVMIPLALYGDRNKDALKGRRWQRHARRRGQRGLLLLRRKLEPRYGYDHRECLELRHVGALRVRPGSALNMSIPTEQIVADGKLRLI
jgi:Ca2+-binding RTX toxin-like protein